MQAKIGAKIALTQKLKVISINRTLGYVTLEDETGERFTVRPGDTLNVTTTYNLGVDQ